MKYLQIFSAVILTIFLVTIPIDGYSTIRHQEPVVVTGEDVQAFQDAPIEELHLYAFHPPFIWRPVLFQIDERDPDGSLFAEDDSVLDGNDEIIFQPQDGGAFAPDSSWIINPEARQNPRIRIVIYDPVDEDSTALYLYRSETLEDTLTVGSMSYENDTDEINSPFYRVGFDDRGFWDEFRFFDIDERELSEDMIDREKIRLSGQVWPLPEWNINEGDFEQTDRQVKSGRLRVSRLLVEEAEILNQPLQKTSFRQYYRSYIVVPGDVLNVPDFGGVTLVRSSFDLTADADGAMESDENNEALTVDGDPDDANTDLSDGELEHKWIKMAFDDNSLVFVLDIDGIAETNNLYYHDNSDGGTADGTEDTGDMESYGDIGFIFTDVNAGRHTLRTKVYMGMGEEMALTGDQCRDYFDTPLQTVLTEESFGEDVVFEDRNATPNGFALNGAYPNPFNAMTNLSYTLPVMSDVSICVYDLSGQLVAVLEDGPRTAGHFTTVWNAQSVSSGVYLVQMETDGGFRAIRKVVLVR
ncbi:MAG: T9SS type A sorting domain-containing protein [Candidatus Electryoneaceae bacterium]|nr:T9SS type A sorting domain-containing protein [Candidatus Electryoneaceae bacterium]